MLVAQAKRACEVFTDEIIDESEIDSITRAVSSQAKNIILVGMPGVGKTTVGKLVAAALSRELVDTDELIVELAGKSIPEIFSEVGEDGFRALENEAVKIAGKKSGVVISTGGGVVTRERNYAPLHQIGDIIFITRELNSLAKNGRPLSLSRDLSEMYAERLPLYRKFCDVEFINDTPQHTAQTILKYFLED